MSLKKLCATTYQLNDMVFNPFDFGLHPDADFILRDLRTSTDETILLIEGQNFRHLSLWSISEFAEPEEQAKNIVDKCAYEGTYTFKLLS